MSKFPSATVEFENETYEAVLARDAVPVFHAGKLVGTGRWNRHKRAIDGLPETIPRPVVLLLSQRLRTAKVAAKVSKAQSKRQARIDRADITQVFAKYNFPATPPDCKRWVQIHVRQFYAAFVLADDSAMLFRNGKMIGSAQWNEREGILHGYIGERIPPYVWERLTQRLVVSPVIP